MDIESRVQKIELECAEVKRALSDLKADHDELRLMAVEIAKFTTPPSNNPTAQLVPTQ
jgi:hypothetical protein